jgi:hypothetical protein
MLAVSNPALKFAVWLLMMDSCFLTHENVIQKGITFLMIPVQKMGTGCPNGYAYIVLESIFHATYRCGG